MIPVEIFRPIATNNEHYQITVEERRDDNEKTTIHVKLRDFIAGRFNTT